MAIYNLNNLKTRVNTYIKQNLNREIRGPVLQGILQDVIDSLNAISSTSIIRSGSATANGGVQTIQYNSDFTENCTIIPYDYNGIGIKITGQDVHGFTIDALTSGNFNYVAIINV